MRLFRCRSSRELFLSHNAWSNIASSDIRRLLCCTTLRLGWSLIKKSIFRLYIYVFTHTNAHAYKHIRQTYKQTSSFPLSFSFYPPTPPSDFLCHSHSLSPSHSHSPSHSLSSLSKRKIQPPCVALGDLQKKASIAPHLLSSATGASASQPTARNIPKIAASFFRGTSSYRTQEDPSHSTNFVNRKLSVNARTLHTHCKQAYIKALEGISIFVTLFLKCYSPCNRTFLIIMN